jgi:hypothetical protein
MPFTLSHAAAALPFRKLKPIWPALVIGTFAPDLPYFILLSDRDRSGHRFPDLLLFTLPVALLILLLFEWIVKGPVIELFPSGIQRRLQDKLKPLAFTGWKQFGLIVLWICVGIATHLLWDQFTHSYSWLPSQWSWLRTRVSVPFVHPMPLTKILQHTSTIFGLGILFGWFVGWYLRTPPVRVSDRRKFSPFVRVAIVSIMGVVALLAGYPLAIFKLSDHPLPVSPLTMIATTLVATIFAFGVQLLIYGLAITVAARSRRVLEPEFDETPR